MRAEPGEHLVEPGIRDAPGRPRHHPWPTQGAALPHERIHRIVVAALPVPRNRERIHNRPGPGFQLEVVEPAYTLSQCAAVTAA